MLTFLFWNLSRRERTELIVAVAREWDVDFLVLAELFQPGQRLLTQLNPLGNQSRYRVVPTQSRLRVITRFGPLLVRPLVESHAYSVFAFRRPASFDLNLALAHLPSKLHARESDQRVSCERLAEAIRGAEVRAGHRRTVLLGDLNIQPFEEGMVSAHGLHGVASRAIANRRQRVVQGQEFDFFYNPMWSLLGDASAGPPGSYYYARSRAVEYYWHMFDQVLLRPDLLPYYRDGGVRILDRVGATRLTDAAGRPAVDIGSDHLPLILQLDI